MQFLMTCVSASLAKPSGGQWPPKGHQELTLQWEDEESRLIIKMLCNYVCHNECNHYVIDVVCMS